MGVGSGFPIFGYDSFVSVGEENITYGTRAAGAYSFIEFNSESFKRNIEEIKIEAINGTRDYIKRLTGNESVEGSLEFPLNVASDGIVYLLKNAMGGTVSSAVIGATAAYNHTVNAGDLQHNKSTAGATDTAGLSFQIRKGGNGVNTGASCWDFLGCKVNQLTIKGEIGSPIMVTAEIIGKTASITSSTPTAVYSDVLPANFTGIQIYTGISIGVATTEECFQSFELAINNNLISDTGSRCLGSRTLNILPAAKREVTLKLNQRYDTTTAYDRFIQETVTAIKITCTGPSMASAGMSSYSMIISLPRCYYNSNMPEVGDAGILSHELNVSVFRENTTGSYPIQMVLTNMTASY